MNQDQNQSDPQKPEKQEDQAVPSKEELTTNDTQEQAQTESEQTEPTSVNTNTEQKSKAIKLIGGLSLIILFIVIAFGLWKAYQPKTVEIQGRVEAETIHVSTKQSNDLNLQYQQFQMGALNGSANWTAELVLDPCKPKEVIQLKGQRIIFNGVGMDMRFVQILILRKHPAHFSLC